MFAAATRGTRIAGCFTSGTFTHQIQAAFWELLLQVVTDLRADHQPLTGASYANLPTTALCNTDSPLQFVDIAIPGSNRGAPSVGLRWWVLTQEVLHTHLHYHLQSNIRGRSHHVSSSTETLETLKRKSEPLLKRL
ncbi:hypothetical protein J1605_002101 [Eschrichtius robustus]|uniref:40S ribosomal protein SA n=1 Tax=Eschrichtius robustus TaxID=9764 RepID=A0AB34I1M4_ESCRO|nr:hypothetical protein J1605_002101 [Eschrichtius robustus]